MTADPDPQSATEPAPLGDEELITAVRAGDPDAFETLYTRHVAPARRLALALARSPTDADDLVAEAFAKLLSILREGGGPDVAFRAYLLTTVRNLFYDRTRRDQRVKVTDDLSGHDAGIPFVDTAVEGLERSLVARAFARLPERWQTVLWHTQVEGESPATVATMLGLTPNGVSALAYRARERLRQNYLREHVTTSPTDQCQATIDRLGAYVRSGLSPRDRSAVDQHLSDCRRCQVLYLELGDVNASLQTVLAPVVLGETAALAYLGSSSATGFSALVTPVWSGTKRIARRRSTQVGAGGAAVAAAVALALLLTGTEVPEPEPDPTDAPPAAGPEPPGAEVPDPEEPPVDEPAPGSLPGAPGSDPGEPGAPGTSPSPEQPSTVEVTLEPVGSLVRDRPGVLALTVTSLGPAGGGGGELQEPPEAADTGPMTAQITVPDGVESRAGTPGNGWDCDGAGSGIRCAHPSLDAGATTRAYVPVAVSASAAEGTPRVQLTGPGIEAAGATSPAGVQSDGLGARFAGIEPATVVAGGNSLLSCPKLDLTCKHARSGGGALGRTDNDDYLMTTYADRDAPAGGPAHAAVSGATLRLPGRVVWAGLYWAGSGSPPSAPTAYLHAPGGNGYAAVRATTVRRIGDGQLGKPAYQASADVTDLVRGSGGGDWWVAVDAGAFARGRGAFGGWSLLVVAEDGGPQRSVAVFDELTTVREERPFAAELYGDAGQAQLAFLGWEGDRGLTGDQLRLDGRPLGGDNVADSRAGGTVDGWNTMGTDARVVPVSFPGGGRPTLSATTGQDAWLLGPVAVVTPPP